MKPKTMEKKEILISRPGMFGKNILVTNEFLASCKAGESVEYRHPKYVAMSNKRYEELVKYRQELKKKVEGMEKRNSNIDDNEEGTETNQNIGYNQALSDILTLLEERKEEK